MGRFMEETHPMFANQPISPSHDVASCDIATTTTTSNPSNVNNSNGTAREIKQERLDDHNIHTNREKINNQQVYTNSYTPASSNAPKERAVDWRGNTPISSSSN